VIVEEEDEVRRASPRKKTVEMTIGVCRRGGRRSWHATAMGDAAAMAEKAELQ